MKKKNNGKEPTLKRRSNTKYKEKGMQIKKRGRQSTKDNREKQNREIAKVMYLFVTLMIICIGYFGIFLGVKGKSVINNSYNKRSNLLAQKIFRGSIYTSDGTKVAYSLDNKDKTETRIYPYGGMFAHVVGRFDNTKTGVEASEDFTLLTSSTNMFEKIYHELTGGKSIGDNIYTTLDYNLQKVAYDALGNHRGAVVVMEPSTGKILAMVSKPDYDPNKVKEQWDSFVENAENTSPLLNRATQGLYPPGSTFKVITLLSYMQQNKNYEKYQYTCKGEAKFEDQLIHCYKNKAHGTQNLLQSFAKSCNTSFVNLGMKLDLAQFRTLCDNLLFNSPLPLNMEYKKSSFVLNSASDKNEIPQTAIGQGKTLMTPIHGGMIMSAIANGGNLMTPYVVDRVENHHGTVIKQNTPEVYRSLIDAKEAQVLTDYMEAVVQSGTAASLKSSNYSVAGKTGTAEYSEEEKPHAWFVGFAPTNQPEIAISVVVESSGVASNYAVPIAKKICDTYFKKNK